jgi:hypothetical protein
MLDGIGRIAGQQQSLPISLGQNFRSQPFERIDPHSLIVGFKIVAISEQHDLVSEAVDHHSARGFITGSKTITIITVPATDCALR